MVANGSDWLSNAADPALQPPPPAVSTGQTPAISSERAGDGQFSSVNAESTRIVTKSLVVSTSQMRLGDSATSTASTASVVKSVVRRVARSAALPAQEAESPTRRRLRSNSNPGELKKSKPSSSKTSSKTSSGKTSSKKNNDK